jgi:multidrug resistance efflux pump
MKGVSMVILAALAAPALGQGVVKSVDEAGNVTYSSSAVPGAVTSEPVKLAPPPSEDSVVESQARADEAVEAAEQLVAEDAQQKAEKDAEAAAANEAVAAAEQALEDAKVIQDSDWQNLQGGGRVLNEGYHQRVKEAEARLARAKREASGSR